MIEKNKAVGKLQLLKGDSRGLVASVFDTCIQGIKEMPEDDGVEIVRCKDCIMWKYYFATKDENGTSVKSGLCCRNNGCTYGTDFCSRGEMEVPK